MHPGCGWRCSCDDHVNTCVLHWSRVGQDLRWWVDNQGHATFTVARHGAVQPEGSGVIDLEAPDISTTGETGIDTGARGQRNTGGIERGLCDRVSGSKGELDPIALGSNHGVGSEAQSRADLD